MNINHRIFDLIGKTVSGVSISTETGLKFSEVEIIFTDGTSLKMDGQHDDAIGWTTFFVHIEDGKK